MHRPSAVLLLAAAIMLASLAPTSAAPITVIKSKTKSGEIEVSIDDALRAYPGLYENLAAEARREAVKWRAGADTALRKKEPPFGTTGGYYEYSRGYTLRSAIGRYISVLRGDSTFTGGAHPNSFTNTILWDRDAKKRISIRPFFRETADNGPTMTAMAKLLRAAVHARKKELDRPVEDDPETDTWLKDIEASLLKLGPVTLAPSSESNRSSGLTFHFSPYAVGPYAEGPLTAFVPWTAFKDFLSPEGTALFAGTRPDDDAANLD
jgi:hypothetical protein